MAANGREICQRFDKLKQRRGNHDARWERMAPFLSPSRVGVTGALAPGDRQTRGVFDSTTMMAAELMAMFVAGHIINPSQQWLGYYMAPGTEDDDSIMEWLEECRDLTLRRLSASLYYAEGPESLIDWAGFGTGFLLTEEAPQPVNRTIKGFRGFYFCAEKTGRFIIEEGSDGLVDTAFREYELSARAIRDRWPDAMLPENITKSLASGEQDKPYKIIHGVYPRPKGEQNSYAANGMPWASCWIDYESKTVLHESGYRIFPAAVPRYHRTPGEVYGRGRGDLAFPDTWTLNTAKRMGLEDWALKIRPPILHGHDSVIGNLKLVPGGPTSVNTHGRPIKDSIMPFETGSHPEVSQIKEEELRKSIRTIFYVDQILALLEVSKSEMTAFEFARKIQLLFRIIGPVYGRLEWEYLHRTADIVFDLQYAAGAFPPPPPAVEQTTGDIGVQFQNPIAKAQREGDADALTMALNDLAPLAQMFPQTLDRLDPDLTANGIMDIRGVPSKWQRSDAQLAELRAARQKQDETDLELERVEQAAGAAGKAAPMLKAIMPAAGGVKK
jgi:head-to-tail connecting protein